MVEPKSVLEMAKDVYDTSKEAGEMVEAIADLF